MIDGRALTLREKIAIYRDIDAGVRSKEIAYKHGVNFQTAVAMRSNPRPAYIIEAMKTKPQPYVHKMPSITIAQLMAGKA